ncbi:hypothetical protein [Roseinatronobacter sp.]
MHTHHLPQATLDQARHFVANPRADDLEFWRTLAWTILKTARNQRVIQSRLPRRPAPPGPANLPRPTPPVNPTGPRTA